MENENENVVEIRVKSKGIAKGGTKCECAVTQVNFEGSIADYGVMMAGIVNTAIKSFKEHFENKVPASLFNAILLSIIETGMESAGLDVEKVIRTILRKRELEKLEDVEDEGEDKDEGEDDKESIDKTIAEILRKLSK